MQDQVTRRKFLERSALFGSATWAVFHLPRPRALAAAQQSKQPAVFTEAQWKTVEAITARIIPTDDQPGAVEANCVNFIDKALANEDAAAKPLYEAGIAGIDAVAAKAHGDPFAELSAKKQDAVLAALEAGDAKGWPHPDIASPLFFETVRSHTVIGFLADPSYGGNQDYAGWRVAGYAGGGHHLGGYSPAQMDGREPIDPVWKHRS